jgi:23S rRNA (cytosine1962-C5)-methyltransferase
MAEIHQILRVADAWQDYELIDCGDGHRLERWGKFKLIRPDPQAIWSPAAPKQWRDADARYRRSTEGGGQWENARQLPEFWTITYRHLTFKVRPTGFKHMGLFPEQAVNWDWIEARIREVKSPVRLLNLFGYTGAATAAAAAAGAQVCHVDAARGMVQWCRENLALSGLEARPVRYIVDDCLAFIRREQRRGRRYDALVMDPPSYGRGIRGEVWKLEDQLSLLLRECQKLLSDTPLFFLVNAYTTGLSSIVLVNLLRDIMPASRGRIAGGELGLPARAGGRILPCGIYAAWERHENP